MCIRDRDVINLSPALVVINAGTNDVAENTQAYNEDYTFRNIVSMAELAKANKDVYKRQEPISVCMKVKIVLCMPAKKNE